MHLPTDLQTFVFLSRYARWRDDLGRRETWPEAVDRYFDFVAEELKDLHNYDISKEISKIKAMVLNLEILPSMRALMTAGPAGKRDHTVLYNCSYLPLNSPRCFDELFYLLMCGVGVGFSVESKYIQKLPVVPEEFHQSQTVIKVADSKPGWAGAFRELLALLWAGQVPTWDLSKLRPAGARLKTMGGRSSGPGPLDDLLKFTVDMFSKARGRQLNSLECHDLACKTGDVVVVGGVRRSALISLSDLDDERLRNAKTGDWYNTHPHRALANNSAIHYFGEPLETFISEWRALYLSNAGERGIVSRDAIRNVVKQFSKRRNDNNDFGVNPCSESILRPFEFCNLTSVICRQEDDTASLLKKVEAAAILGTWQSALTKFKYLRRVWTEVTEEDRLLGVSLNGVFDCPELTNVSKSLLERLKQKVIDTNAIHAKAIGIPQSVATTLQKPEGTTSQLVNCASGGHPRFAPYYLRRVRQDNKDPITKFMKDIGFSWEPCVMKPHEVSIFAFPVKSPEKALCTKDLSAVEHLGFWKTYQEYWCEHKPSVTVTVKDTEWLEVAAWVWKHMGILSGVSFLPATGQVYKQMPYEEITEAQYNEAMSKIPQNVDWSKLKDYESEDNTKVAGEFTCVGAVCEVLGSAD